MWRNFFAPILSSCGRAAIEVAVVTIVGLAPLFVLVIRSSENGADPGQVAADALSRVQLFFYAFSLIGTLVWLTIVNWRLKSSYIKSILGLAVVVSIILTFSFGVFDPTFKTLNSPASIIWSYVLFGTNVAIYFAIMVLTHLEPVNLRDALRDGASSMILTIGGKERPDE